MTDQKPNCHTCPKEHTKNCPIDFEKSNDNSDIFDGMNRVTRNCLMGCHPGAREYLMKDVIEELERCMQPGHSLWAHYSPNEIVTLIKEGVK
jgi:hypothetical protein